MTTAIDAISALYRRTKHYNSSSQQHVTEEAIEYCCPRVGLAVEMFYRQVRYFKPHTLAKDQNDQVPVIVTPPNAVKNMFWLVSGLACECSGFSSKSHGHSSRGSKSITIVILPRPSSVKLAVGLFKKRFPFDFLAWTRSSAPLISSDRRQCKGVPSRHTFLFVEAGVVLQESRYVQLIERLTEFGLLAAIVLDHIHVLDRPQFEEFTRSIGLVDGFGIARCPVLFLGSLLSERFELRLRHGWNGQDRADRSRARSVLNVYYSRVTSRGARYRIIHVSRISRQGARGSGTDQEQQSEPSKRLQWQWLQEQELKYLSSISSFSATNAVKSSHHSSRCDIDTDAEEENEKRLWFGAAPFLVKVSAGIRFVTANMQSCDRCVVFCTNTTDAQALVLALRGGDGKESEKTFCDSRCCSPVIALPVFNVLSTSTVRAILSELSGWAATPRAILVVDSTADGSANVIECIQYEKVRYVIHCRGSTSLEQYYYETEIGGQDGQPFEAITFVEDGGRFSDRTKASHHARRHRAPVSSAPSSCVDCDISHQMPTNSESQFQQYAGLSTGECRRHYLRVSLGDRSSGPFQCSVFPEVTEEQSCDFCVARLD